MWNDKPCICITPSSGVYTYICWLSTPSLPRTIDMDFVSQIFVDGMYNFAGDRWHFLFVLFSPAVWIATQQHRGGFYFNNVWRLLLVEFFTYSVGNSYLFYVCQQLNSFLFLLFRRGQIKSTKYLPFSHRLFKRNDDCYLDL
jgi:hypothetical protein